MQIQNTAVAGQVNGSIVNAPHIVRRSASPHGRDFDKIREQEQEREMKLREEEDKRIADIQKAITETAELPGNTDEERKNKEARINTLTEQIQQIYKNRAEREKLAAEREMERRKQEIEEKRREQEKANEAQKVKNENPNETREDRLRREQTRSMVELSISKEGMAALRQTRANMSAEATQLKQDIENEETPMVINPEKRIIYHPAYDKDGNRTSGFNGFTIIGDETVKVKSGYMTPNDFRNTHLRDLNEGIAGLSSAIHQSIAEMNRDTGEWAERSEEILSETEKPKNEKVNGEKTGDTHSTEKEVTAEQSQPVIPEAGNAENNGSGEARTEKP